MVSSVLTVNSIIIVIMKGPFEMKFLAQRSILTIILISSIFFVGCSERQTPAANTRSEDKPAAKSAAEIAYVRAEPVIQVVKPVAKAIDVRKEPDSDAKKLFDEYFAAVSGLATIEQTRAIAEKIIASNDQMMMMNDFAWDIMMRKNIDDAKRDYEIAVKVASKANTITKGKNSFILDTYAMALYKTGKYEEALAAQQKAVNLAPGCVRSQYRSRLETYKKGLAK
jgi:Tfp pilus assembly protein PilF